MTIDSDGSLYVAACGGSKVLKINPNAGVIELEIKFPVEQITSVAFGGPNLDILYATSAAADITSTQPPPAGMLHTLKSLPAGKLFAVKYWTRRKRSSNEKCKIELDK